LAGLEKPDSPVLHSGTSGFGNFRTGIGIGQELNLKIQRSKGALRHGK
jgi:hypothetical protein